jgi:hypothetical protein
MNKINNIISVDRFLSIWIFIYTIAYILKIVPYNPIFLLGIAIVFFAFGLLITIYNLNDKSLLLYYFVINFIGKIVPFFLIINNKFTNDDIVFTLYFILLYVIYMQIINDDIICVYIDYMLFIIDRDKGREGALYNFIKKSGLYV